MPMGYGGGIRSLEDARQVLSLGFEKVAVNAAALADPTCLGRIADSCGSQSVVAAIDVKRDWLGRRRVYDHVRRRARPIDPAAHARAAVAAGAGRGSRPGGRSRRQPRRLRPGARAQRDAGGARTGHRSRWSRPDRRLGKRGSRRRSVGRRRRKPLRLSRSAAGGADLLPRARGQSARPSRGLVKIGVVLINSRVGGTEKRIGNLFSHLSRSGRHDYTLLVPSGCSSCSPRRRSWRRDRKACFRSSTRRRPRSTTSSPADLWSHRSGTDASALADLAARAQEGADPLRFHDAPCTFIDYRSTRVGEKDVGEEGSLRGLGWLDAETVRFRMDPIANGSNPYVGWNRVTTRKSSPLLEDMYPKPIFYFVHSCHVVCADQSDVLAVTTYGYEFPSCLQRGNIYATQFHPEKCHKYALRLIRNFIERV